MSSSDRQAADFYPEDFELAVQPDELAPYNCDHENAVCMCVHDWRIFWGNKPKVQQNRATTLGG